jgi:hypothetical protein
LGALGFPRLARFSIAIDGPFPQNRLNLESLASLGIRLPFLTPKVPVPKKNRIPHKFLPWIEARKKYQLTHAQTQMARELGMDPTHLRTRVKKSDPRVRLPIPELIETLYLEHFGREQPEVVRSIEELAAEHLQRRAEKKLNGGDSGDGDDDDDDNGGDEHDGPNNERVPV